MNKLLTLTFGVLLTASFSTTLTAKDIRFYDASEIWLSTKEYSACHAGIQYLVIVDRTSAGYMFPDRDPEQGMPIQCDQEEWPSFGAGRYTVYNLCREGIEYVHLSSHKLKMASQKVDYLGRVLRC